MKKGKDMNLSTDKDAELKKLTQYFEKIESIAARMGVEIDDLIQEYKNNNTAVYANLKKSILAIAKQRKHVFERADKGSSPEEAQVIGLNILVNEDYPESNLN